MNADEELIGHIVDLLGNSPEYSSRKMFGGYGIYHEDDMFGLIAEGALYLKVDDVNQDRFISEGLEPFVYSKGDKPVKMSYYEAPDSALESPEIMAEWVEFSIAAAQRNVNTKKTEKRNA